MPATSRTRITLADAAAHYRRSTRWVRLQVAALTDAERAALHADYTGPRHERVYDRETLLAALDAVLASQSEIGAARMGYLAGHMGVPRARDEQGTLLCASPGCRRTVVGRRQLCDVHTTPRSREDRRQRARRHRDLGDAATSRE